jgi:hypothetical protein
MLIRSQMACRLLEEDGCGLRKEVFSPKVCLCSYITPLLDYVICRRLLCGQTVDANYLFCVDFCVVSEGMVPSTK